jgi:hypothetical protein
LILVFYIIINEKNPKIISTWNKSEHPFFKFYIASALEEIEGDGCDEF